MAEKFGGKMIEVVRALAQGGHDGGVPDGELLDRYSREHDDSAFAALVRRHAGMVLGIARRVLGHDQDAEDVCQATFLLLARKSSRGLRRESVAGWLCATARLTALNLRKAKVRRTRAETQTRACGAGDRTPLEQMTGAELVIALDEELARLHDRYRGPLVLCCLEGLARETAARRLGVPLGTLRVQMERARERLRLALEKRGIELGVALLAVTVASAGRASPQLVRSVMAAVGGAVPPTVAFLTQGGIMAMTKMKFLLVAALAVGLAVAGAGAGARLLSVGDQLESAEAKKPRALQSAAPAKKPAPSPNRSKNDIPVEVTGQVLGSDGKPCEGAKLYVGYATPHGWGLVYPAPESIDSSERDALLKELGWLRQARATTGPDGRFRFNAAKSDWNDVLLAEGAEPAVIVIAPGSGPDWAPLWGKSAGVTLRLVRDDIPIQGRILDEDGQPVKGAKVQVVCLAVESADWQKKWAGPVPGQPSSVLTGADGRFRLTGLGKDRQVTLRLEGATIEHRQISAWTRATVSADKQAKPEGHGLPATFEFVASASRVIRGLVRDKATGKPLGGVRMSTQTFRTDQALTYTNAEGRYELIGCPKSSGYQVSAQPQNGQIYFAAEGRAIDTPGLEAVVIDFKLVAGIELRGKMTDRATGKPPGRAVVKYFPLYPNDHARTMPDYPSVAASSAFTGLDGSYRLAVLPGPGVIGVTAAPLDSYAYAVVTPKQVTDLLKGAKDQGNKELAEFFKAEMALASVESLLVAHGVGFGGILQERYCSLALINPAKGAVSSNCDIVLEPARTIGGTVIGPNGKPRGGVTVRGLEASVIGYPRTLETAEFTVKRMTPGRARQLVFESKSAGLGKFVVIPGDRSEEIVVRLEPYASVTGQLLDKDKKPVAGLKLQRGEANFVSGDYGEKTDADGRFRIKGLIPGQKYRVGGGRAEVGWQVEFTAESGPLKDLGVVPRYDQ